MPSRDYPLATSPEPAFLGLGNPEKKDQRRYRKEERKMERQSRQNMKGCSKGRCAGNSLFRKNMH